MKNKNYAIYRNPKYLTLLLCFALVLIVLPIVLAVVFCFVPLCCFGMCGVILLAHFLYEYFYTKKCRILITEREIEITKPFFYQKYKVNEVFWRAKRIGLRGGYKIYIKHGYKTAIRITLDWENIHHILKLNHCKPSTPAEKEVIRIVRLS